MTDQSRESVKQMIKTVLMELKDGTGINRMDLWSNIFNRLLDDDILLLEDIQGAFGNTVTDDKYLRDIVVELVKDGCCFGSSTARGYFNINGEDDFNEAVKMYDKKIRGLAMHRNQIKKNTENKLGRKLSDNAFYGEDGIGKDIEPRETLFEMPRRDII